MGGVTQRFFCFFFSENLLNLLIVFFFFFFFLWRNIRGWGCNIFQLGLTMTGPEQSRLILQFTRCRTQSYSSSRWRMSFFFTASAQKTRLSQVVERSCHVTNAASLAARRRENNNSNNVSSFFPLCECSERPILYYEQIICFNFC